MSDQTERLSAIQKRVDDASPGPWEHTMSNEDYPPIRYTVITASHGDHLAELDEDQRADLREGPMADANADAWFIANAPADIAFLLELVRKQQDELDSIGDIA